jgi:hypothetical protein
MTARALLREERKNPGRFSSSKTVGAHFGMMPKKYQSGETDVTGRISKTTGIRGLSNEWTVELSRFIICRSRPKARPYVASAPKCAGPIPNLAGARTEALTGAFGRKFQTHL